MAKKKTDETINLKLNFPIDQQEFYLIYSLIGGMANGDKFNPENAEIVKNSFEYTAANKFFAQLNKFAPEEMQTAFALELEASLLAMQKNPINADKMLNGMLDLHENTLDERELIENELKVVTDQTNSIKKCKDCGTPLKKNEKVYCFDCL